MCKGLTGIIERGKGYYMNDPEFWFKLILKCVAFFGIGTTIFILGMAYALHYPEKIQKWMVFVWKVIRLFWEKAEKKIVSNDIEGRVNEFSRELKKELPDCEPIGIKIQWVEEGQNPEQFFRENRLIIRMRKHQNQNKNFVYASMVFISEAILKKVKTYISKTQRESIDLFIAKKLFEKEKPKVLDEFFSEYLSVKINESDKIAELVGRYDVIDKAGLFFPILVQELTFLGEKVFLKKREDRIIVEVTKFIEYLNDYANRELGEDVQPFLGAYCRCAIMIIAKKLKREMGNIRPYVNYISELVHNKMESIYLIGASTKDNVMFMDKIINDIQTKNILEKYSEKIYRASIKVHGERRPVSTYLVLLRNPKAIRMIDEEYQEKYIQALIDKEPKLIKEETSEFTLEGNNGNTV